MHRVFREYERRKADEGAIDFEDLLGHDDRVCSRTTSRRSPTVRDRWRAFTVDEYQDVNLLQQTLLDLWLGAARRPLRRRRRLPVDLRLHRRERRAGCSACRRRFPHATVVRLERQLPLHAAGARACEPARAEARRLREDPARDGPETGRSRSCAPFATPASRERAIAARVRAARRGRRPARGAGGALRTNARTDRVRRGVPRGGYAVPGRVAARPRRGAAAC